MKSSDSLFRVLTVAGVFCSLAACSAPEADLGTEDVETVSQASHGGPRKANLIDANGNSVGKVVFARVAGRVVVGASVRGLAPASDFHGFHVHANDNPANGDGCVPPSFVSTDGHYNPGGDSHGDHAGDMPVLFAMADGTARLSYVTDAFSLPDLVGRAVIIHAGRNNYGNIPVGPNPDQYTPNNPDATALTVATGNAGARIACGVIE